MHASKCRSLSRPLPSAAADINNTPQLWWRAAAKIPRVTPCHCGFQHAGRPHEFCGAASQVYYVTTPYDYL